MDHLKYKALIQESDALSDGFRAGIRVLCTGFYAKELLTPNLYHMGSNESISEETRVEKVLSALQDRVKLDSTAFDDILSVLHETMGLDYLAKRLEKRLGLLEQARQVDLEKLRQELQLNTRIHNTGARVREERVMVSGASLLMGRPTDLGVASFRKVESVMFNTEPAALSKQIKSPQSYFQTAADHQANSVGSDMHLLPGGHNTLPRTDPGSHSPVYQRPIAKTHRREEPQGRLEIGMPMNKVQFGNLPPHSPSTAVAGDLVAPSDSRGRGKTADSVATDVEEAIRSLDLSQGNNTITEPEAKPSHHARSHDLTATPTNTLSRSNDDTKSERHPSQEDTAEHKAVPESYPQMARNNSVYLASHKHMYSTGSNLEDEFNTPPSSPLATPDNITLEESKPCSQCFQMKRKMSVLENKLKSLELSKEKEIKISQQQVQNLKTELNKVSQENYEMQMAYQKLYIMELASDQRHQEQDSLINSLHERIRQLQHDSETRAKTDRETRARMEKAERNHKIQKDQDNFEKEQLKWEKEETGRRNESLRRKNRELNEKIQQLYCELKRANSLQCDEQPKDMPDCGHQQRDHTHQQRDHTHQQGDHTYKQREDNHTYPQGLPATPSYTTQAPPSGHTYNHAHQQVPQGTNYQPYGHTYNHA